MGQYAIVRQDGEVDQAEGDSVADVSNRYGWPGNGTIEEWNSAVHGDKLRHVFSGPTGPADQVEALADKADTADTADDTEDDQ